MTPLERELGVMRGFCSCRGDEDRVDEAEAEYRTLKARVNELEALVRRQLNWQRHLGSVNVPMSGAEIDWIDCAAKALGE